MITVASKSARSRKILFALFSTLAMAFGVLYVAFAPRNAPALYRTLLFHPHSLPKDFPAPMLENVQGVEVRIGKEENLDLYGWYFAAPNSKFVVLINHGNGGNIKVREDLVQLLLKQNLSVLIYDYCGYGKSGGLPDTVNVIQASECAYRYLLDHEHYRTNQIIVYGESLGGAVAAHLASRFKPAGLIIQSGFGSLRSVALEHLPLLAIYPNSLLPQPFFDTISLLPSIHAPVLVIHGELDSVVPFHHGEDIFRLAREPKAFIKLPLAHHGDVIHEYSDEVGVAIKNFVERLNPPTVSHSEQRH